MSGDHPTVYSGRSLCTLVSGSHSPPQAMWVPPPALMSGAGVWVVVFCSVVWAAAAPFSRQTTSSREGDEAVTGVMLGSGVSRVCGSLPGARPPADPADTANPAAAAADPGAPRSSKTAFQSIFEASYDEANGVLGSLSSGVAAGASESERVSESAGDPSSFTVCAFVRIHRSHERSSLLTYISEVNINIEVSRLGVALQVREEEGKRETIYQFFEVKFPPYVWRHLCLQFDHNTTQVRCFVDGDQEMLSVKRLLTTADWQVPSLNDGEDIGLVEESVTDVKVDQTHCPLAGEMICTAEEASNNNVFPEGSIIRGTSPTVLQRETGVVCVGGCDQHHTLEADVAGVTVWRRTLGAEILKNISGCHPHQRLHFDQVINLRWSVFGNVSLRSYSRRNLCLSIPRVVVIQAAGTYARHQSVCQALGGTLAFSTELTTLGVARGFSDTCGDTSGLMAWLREDRRVSEAGKTNTEKCPALSVGSRDWVSCELQLKCAMCQVPNTLMYILYGHNGKLFDHNYFIPADTRSLQFRGLGESEIIRKGQGWLLRSTLHLTEWLLEEADMPVGRQKWNVGSQMVVLTLTICRTIEFACDDGQCVPHTARCDDIVHCNDGSDEVDCRVVERPSSYDLINPPPSRPGEAVPLHLNYHIDVYNLNDVTTKEGVASMDLGITVSWFDPRLKFLNLKEGIKNYFPCELVWTPRVRALSGRGHGTVLTSNNYEKFCYAYSNDQTELRPLHDPLMSHQADGLTNAVELYLGVLAKVPCHFQLQMYPFDVQRCNLSFVVMNAPFTRAFRKSSPGSQVPYLNARRMLLEYLLENLTTEAGWSQLGSDNNTYIVLTYHLRRLYGYHLTNSFFLSLLIFFISYATFFFQMEDFTNRIMVSLTAQLVLAELFTSTTQSSARTPYLKLIDLWYAVVITLCFLIVVTQTVFNVILNAGRFPGVFVRVRESWYELVAEEICRELVAEEIYRELVAEEICRELVAEEICRELVAEEICRELVAEEICRELVAKERIHRSELMLTLLSPQVTPAFTSPASRHHRHKHKHHQWHSATKPNLELAQRCNFFVRVGFLFVAAIFVFFYVLMAAGVWRLS
ncbi:uncharacterized protein [Cherax quadricarinatus]|uniref:uncharacterized protein n=1 Tax=Cherax quadricarinatus TaxID=27406 RepID=UPI00387E94C0